jgi:hypothetical protein
VRDTFTIPADGTGLCEESVGAGCGVAGGPFPVGLPACIAAFVTEGFFPGVGEVAVPGEEVGLL